jgi:hypothetical protein
MKALDDREFERMAALPDAAMKVYRDNCKAYDYICGESPGGVAGKRRMGGKVQTRKLMLIFVNKW